MSSALRHRKPAFLEIKPRFFPAKTRFLPGECLGYRSPKRGYSPSQEASRFEGLPRPGLEVRFPTTAFGKNLVFDRERLESNLLQGAFATSAIVAPLIKTRRLDGSYTPAKSKVPEYCSETSQPPKTRFSPGAFAKSSKAFKFALVRREKRGFSR